jgi:hypothetical protein
MIDREKVSRNERVGNQNEKKEMTEKMKEAKKGERKRKRKRNREEMKI